MHYVNFEQKQYGTFVLQDTYKIVGTTHVGPCVVLFLFNTASKECLAFHIDAGTSIECVSFIAGLFLKRDDKIDNYQAFVVGGWRNIPTSFKRSSELIDWLHGLNINTNTQFLYAKEFNGMLLLSHRNYIDFVGFDLETGKLIVHADPVHSMLPLPTDEEQKLLIKNCIYYLLLANNRTISDTIAQYFSSQTALTLNPKTLEFLQRLIKINNGTPAIPFKVKGLIKTQQEKLVTHINSANIFGIIDALYTHITSPVTALLSSDINDTALHIGCNAVNITDRELVQRQKAIVLLLLLRGRDNPTNANGIRALDMLPNGVFKNACQRLIQVFAVDDMNITCLTTDLALATFINILNIEISMQDNSELNALYEDDTLIFMIDSIIERSRSKPLLFASGQQYCKRISACDVATVAVTALAATSAYLALRL